jgi:cytochrome c-type biogenesis protein CcmE
MKGLKKKRRVQVMALSGVCVAAVLGLLALLPDESFQFFRSPSEVAADPPRETELFRIGGLVPMARSSAAPEPRCASA